MSADPTRDLPDAAMLVTAARETLVAQVLPSLTGDARIAALMVANALGIAARELGTPAEAPAEASSKAPADAAARVAAIRAGAHDADAALHAALVDAARARVAVSRPAALDAGPPPAPREPDRTR